MFRSLRAGATLAAGLFAAAAVAAPVSTEELATLCANAEDSAHCGRLVETEQMKSLPHLACLLYTSPSPRD